MECIKRWWRLYHRLHLSTCHHYETSFFPLSISLREYQVVEGSEESVMMCRGCWWLCLWWRKKCVTKSTLTVWFHLLLILIPHQLQLVFSFLSSPLSLHFFKYRIMTSPIKKMRGRKAGKWNVPGSSIIWHCSSFMLAVIFFMSFSIFLLFIFFSPFPCFMHHIFPFTFSFMCSFPLLICNLNPTIFSVISFLSFLPPFHLSIKTILDSKCSPLLIRLNDDSSTFSFLQLLFQLRWRPSSRFICFNIFWFQTFLLLLLHYTT